MFMPKGTLMLAENGAENKLRFLRAWLIGVAVFLCAWGLQSSELSQPVSLFLKKQPHSWYVELRTDDRPIEQNIYRLAVPLEQILRPVAGIRQITNFTYQNKVVAAFYTESSVDTEEFRATLTETLSHLKDLPGVVPFEHVLFYKPLKESFLPESKTVADDAEMLPEALFANELYLLFGSSPLVDSERSILDIAPSSLALDFDFSGFNKKDLPLAFENLQRFLAESQNTPGVQLAFAKHVYMPTLSFHVDGAYLAKEGTTSGDFFQSLQQIFEQNTFKTNKLFGRQQSLIDSVPPSLKALTDSKTVLSNNYEFSAGELASLSQTTRILATMSASATLTELGQAYRFGKSAAEQNDKLLPTSIKYLYTDSSKAIKAKSLIREKLERYPLLHSKISKDSIEILDAVGSKVMLHWVCAAALLLYVGLFSIQIKKSSSAVRSLFGTILSVCLFLSFAILANFDLNTNLIWIFCVSAISHWIAEFSEESSFKSNGEKSFFAVLEFSRFLLCGLLALTIASSTLAKHTTHFGLQALLPFIFAAISPAFAFSLLRASTSGQNRAFSTNKNLPQRRLIGLALASLTCLAGFGIIAISHYINSEAFSTFNVHTMVGNHGQSQALLSLSNALVADSVNDSQTWGTNVASRVPSSVVAETILPSFGVHSVLNPQTDVAHVFNESALEKDLQATVPQPLGWFSLRDSGQGTRIPVFGIDDQFSDPGRTAGVTSIGALRIWSMRNSHLEPRFLLSAKPLLTRAVRVNESPASLIKFVTLTGPTYESATLLERLHSLMAVNFHSYRLDTFSTHESRLAMNIDFLEIFAGFCFLMFFFSAIFFNSIQRAVLSIVTFCILAFLFFTVNFCINLIDDSAMRINSVALFSLFFSSLMLTSLWASLTRTADLIRKANLDLVFSLQPILKVGRLSRNLLAALALPSLVLVYFFPAFLPHVVVLTVFLTSLWAFVPGWIYGWDRVSELFQQATLKLTIHFLKNSRMENAARVGIFLLFCGYGILSSSSAWAESSTRSLDANCKTQAAVILPLAGRPKGKEPAPQRAIYAERLAQEIPCSWIDSSLQDQITNLVQNARGSGEQTKLLEQIKKLVEKERPRLEAETQKRFGVAAGGQELQTQIIGGFYEEFFSNIAFTVINFHKDGRSIPVKVTITEISGTDAIAQIGEFFRGESIRVFEEILGENERIPVFLEPVESLDKHPLSENLAQEMDLFLRSRLTHPFQAKFLERKTFFRAEVDPRKAKHSINVKIRREGTRFYASMSTVSIDQLQRRSSWVEGDVSQLPLFEEEVLASVQKSLTANEQISDYAVFAVGEFLIQESESVRMFGVAFRQNLGNAAFTFRIRNGARRTTNSVQLRDKQSLLSGGVAGGWQYADFRWFVSDAGLGLDLGALTNTTAANGMERTLLITYGPYVQSQFILRNRISFLARLGSEFPQLLGEKNAAKKLPAVYLNLSLGAGISF